ncbi:uncharacterized protein LY89DRAFT_682850, partial [Mollisia scopiformis]
MPAPHFKGSVHWYIDTCLSLLTAALTITRYSAKLHHDSTPQSNSCKLKLLDSFSNSVRSRTSANPPSIALPAPT